MSGPKIFITGATGYIGGDLVYLINKHCPDWQIACLVRDPAKGKNIVSKYANVRIVEGNLDSVETIEREAAEADLVYHCASSDHVASARAIAKGIRHHSTSSRYWIHTSGAGILTHQNFSRNNFETICEGEKVYDDWEHVDELTSLPDKALHRHVDKIVLGASAGCGDRVKTAIISPPAIYGLGRGTGNNKSVQVNMAIQLSLKNRQALQMGDGTSVWHAVHIYDLAKLYLMLGQDGLSKKNRASWNQTGYYLAENGSFTWGAIAQAVAYEAQAQGYLPTNKVQSINFEQAQKYNKFFPYLCGTTSRGVSKRARNLLGWEPTQKGLMEELPAIVRDEAKSLGMKAHTKESRL